MSAGCLLCAGHLRGQGAAVPGRPTPRHRLTSHPQSMTPAFVSLAPTSPLLQARQPSSVTASQASPRQNPTSDRPRQTWPDSRRRDPVTSRVGPVTARRTRRGPPVSPGTRGGVLPDPELTTQAAFPPGALCALSSCRCLSFLTRGSLSSR